jgi:biotin carboxyl carrier protein
MENIIVKFDGKEFNIKYSNSNFANIAVNDKIYTIELLKKIHDNVFSFSINQKLVEVEMDFSDKNILNISINGFDYQIEITDSTKQLLEKFIKSSSKANHGIRQIKAPMPGMIVKLFANEGNNVMEGDKLLVIEAMKMENVLKSPISGILKSVKVKEGTPVNKDELLLEIEPI